MKRKSVSGRLPSILLAGILFCLAVSLIISAAPAFGAEKSVVLRANHPAVGAWFGKAVEDCVGPPETNCGGLGFPAVTILMTPSFYADGNFLGNDSLALAGAPFGPHTTAHGEWVPTKHNEIEADIVFMLNLFPPPLKASTGGVHIKYSAKVISPNVMVGYVNLYFAPPLELVWENLSAGQFPTLPDAATGLLTAPDKVFTSQADCVTAECPLVFRFTVHRVRP